MTPSENLAAQYDRIDAIVRQRAREEAIRNLGDINVLAALTESLGPIEPQPDWYDE